MGDRIIGIVESFYFTLPKRPKGTCSSFTARQDCLLSMGHVGHMIFRVSLAPLSSNLADRMLALRLSCLIWINTFYAN